VRTLSPGPLATAPTPALAGSWRIINTERWAHAPRRTYSSGPAQSAVPDARATAVLVCPVAVAELVGWVW
jgi:hypothetical protein